MIDIELNNKLTPEIWNNIIANTKEVYSLFFIGKQLGLQDKKWGDIFLLEDINAVLLAIKEMYVEIQIDYYREYQILNKSFIKGIIDDLVYLFKVIKIHGEINYTGEYLIGEVNY